MSSQLMPMWQQVSTDLGDCPHFQQDRLGEFVKAVLDSSFMKGWHDLPLHMGTVSEIRIQIMALALEHQIIVDSVLREQVQKVVLGNGNDLKWWKTPLGYRGKGYRPTLGYILRNHPYTLFLYKPALVTHLVSIADTNNPAIKRELVNPTFNALSNVWMPMLFRRLELGEFFQCRADAMNKGFELGLYKPGYEKDAINGYVMAKTGDVKADLNSWHLQVYGLSQQQPHNMTLAWVLANKPDCLLAPTLVNHRTMVYQSLISVLLDVDDGWYTEAGYSFTRDYHNPQVLVTNATSDHLKRMKLVFANYVVRLLISHEWKRATNANLNAAIMGIQPALDEFRNKRLLVGSLDTDEPGLTVGEMFVRLTHAFLK